MNRVFPQYLLGTDALVSVCIHSESDPFRWVWDTSKSHLNARGLVISVASIQQIYQYIQALAASTGAGSRDNAKCLQNRIGTVIELFHQKNCVVPITFELLEYTNNQLDFDISYHRRDNSQQVLGLFEKIVLATSIVGFKDQPICLIDYDQPDAFQMLKRDHDLRVGAFPTRPGNWNYGAA